MEKSQNVGTKNAFTPERKNEIIILMAFYISYETNVKFFLNSLLTISLGVLLNKTFFFLNKIKHVANQSNRDMSFRSQN